MSEETTKRSMYDQRLSGGYYFTGSQSIIYVGDNQIAEINALQGFYQMDYTPVYGYASTHYDAMAHGKAIGAGNFTINYVFPGYLYGLVKEAVEEKKSKGSSASDRKGSYTFKDLPEVKNDASDSSAISNSEARRAINSNIYERKVLTKDMIKYYQDAYWGKGATGNPLDSNMSASLIQHPEFIGPFDIIVRDFKIGSANNNEREYYADYVEKRFVDCFITKYSTIRSPSPTATQEQYDFICRIII